GRGRETASEWIHPGGVGHGDSAAAHPNKLIVSVHYRAAGRCCENNPNTGCGSYADYIGSNARVGRLADADVVRNKSVGINGVAANLATVNGVVIANQVYDGGVDLGRGCRLLDLVVENLALGRPVADEEAACASAIVVERCDMRGSG